MTFGKTIKELRMARDMTQEQLAQLLNLSPQAVSRWETGAAMPDISLLPPLANLFGVTTDFLLGMDTYEKDLQKEKYDAICAKYWQYDDKEKNYQLALQAVEEYPGNLNYLEWLAASEYYVAFLRRGSALEDNGQEFRRMLDCAIKHYKIVCQNTHSVNQRTNALHGIVCSYHFKGDLAAAKEYALLEEDETKRNQLLTLCLQGEEKRRHCQQLAHTHLYEFLHYLESGCPTRTVYCAVEQLVALLFPDGNLQDFHGLLANVLQKHSYIACKEEDYDETVALLQKAKYHTEQFIRYSAQDFYRYSSPFFDLIGDTKIASDTPDAPLENFRNFLESNTVYDPIRHRAEFQALTQK